MRRLLTRETTKRTSGGGWQLQLKRVHFVRRYDAPTHYPSLLLLTVLLATGCHAPKAETSQWSPKPAVASPDVMDRFRAMDGTWTANYDNPDFPPAETKYRTIAAGSAVVETIFEGQPHEMITVIHLDGDQLRATHYCAAQNQPNLVAEAITPEVVEFATLDVTNIASPDALYMGAARYEGVDDDHVTVRWTSFEKGQRGEDLSVKLSRNTAVSED